MSVIEKPWLSVDSSCLKAVRYHNTERWLDVLLKTGKAYRYTNVAFTEYSDLLGGGSSGSVGKEFNNIKLRHEGEVQEIPAIL